MFIAAPALGLSAVACGGEPVDSPDPAMSSATGSPAVAGSSGGSGPSGATGPTDIGGSPVATTRPLVINFQPGDRAALPGSLPDTGAVFGDRGQGLSYGWSVDHGTRAVSYVVPLAEIDPRFWSLMQVLPGDTTWEIAVPNGRYSVRLVVGAPVVFGYPQRMSVEGVATVDETPAEYESWIAGTSVVTVSDGRITVSNTDGADHNSLCFIEITPEPAAPSS